MIWSKKRIGICFSISAIVFLTLILYSVNYYWTKRSSLQLTKKNVNVNYKFNVSKSTITQVKNSKTFIISPYHDDRGGSMMTRTIAIVHGDVKELYCWFPCQTNNNVYVMQATIDMHVDRFDFPYVTTDILCSEPLSCDPKYVSIHSSQEGNIDQLPIFEIRNLVPKTTFSVDFTVCISTMFGNYDNVLQFIQTIEMYKLLGAQRVTIYKNNCSPLIETLLQYYIREGTVEVVPWPIEEYVTPANAWHHSMDAKDIGYYGQLVTLNDCIYRNMYRSKYVMLNDLDEIILPFKHQDWKSMMDSLQNKHPNTHAFLFENHIFPKNVFTSTDEFNTLPWKAVPGIDILQHVHREPDRKDFYNARKLIVNPRKIIQTSVHSVLKAYGESLHVSNEIALVYHCRGPLQAALPRESLIEDPTIWKFHPLLIENVNKVLTRNMLLNQTENTSRAI